MPGFWKDFASKMALMMGVVAFLQGCSLSQRAPSGMAKITLSPDLQKKLLLDFSRQWKGFTTSYFYVIEVSGEGIPTGQVRAGLLPCRRGSSAPPRRPASRRPARSRRTWSHSRSHPSAVSTIADDPTLYAAMHDQIRELARMSSKPNAANEVLNATQRLVSFLIFEKTSKDGVALRYAPQKLTQGERYHLRQLHLTVLS
jgi:hypothetical protein